MNFKGSVNSKSMIVAIALGMLSCRSAPPVKGPEQCSDKDKPSAQAPTLTSDSSATAQADPCEKQVCTEGKCQSQKAKDGTACTPTEEWVEGPSHCYAGQCLSRRICAKACFFEIVVAMKPDTDQLVARCPSREQAPEDFEECVMGALNPHSPLAKRTNHQIHDCMVTCGYPPLMNEAEIMEYEANGP